MPFELVRVRLLPLKTREEIRKHYWWDEAVPFELVGEDHM